MGLKILAFYEPSGVKHLDAVVVDIYLHAT
jgi:hypothetical protein